MARIVLVKARIFLAFRASQPMKLIRTKDVIRTNAERIARPTILEVVSDCDARADLTAASDIRTGLGGVFDAHLARIGDTCPPVVGQSDTHWISTERDLIAGELASLFARVQMDIVHTHRLQDLEIVGAAAREAGVPCLVHTICGEFAAADRTGIERLRDLVNRFAINLIAPSSEVSHRLGDLGGASVVPCSIDCARYQPDSSARARQKIGLPEGPRVVGCASPAAGLEMLFQALVELERDVHVALFGPASPGPAERAMIRTMDLEERVHVLGGWALPELIHQAIDIYYHGPSNDQAPRPVLAAQACGKPVVATYPAASEFLCPQTGHLLPAQSRPTLVAAINRALPMTPNLTARSFVEKHWNLGLSIGIYELVLRSAFQNALEGSDSKEHRFGYHSG